MKTKIINLFYIIVVISAFNACSSKSALSVFGEDSLYEKGLEYTKVEDIVNSFETKAIINATYLNATNPNKWDNKYQNFLIGIYIVDDNDKKENKYIKNKKYILMLNNKKFDKLEELTKKDNLWEHIPVKNPHAKYYIVSFKKDKSTKLNLLYSHISYGKVNLSFEAN